MIDMHKRSVLACLFAAAAVAVAHALWLNDPTSGVPRLPNGKVNLAAKPPYTSDGKPDLTGVWYPNILQFAEIQADLATKANER